MKDYLNSLADHRKAELYFRLLDGLIGLYDGRADDSGLDNSDRQEIFSELQNAIFALRQNWKEI